MFNYVQSISKLDEQGVVDAKTLFTVSTLANFAKQNINAENVVNIDNRNSNEYSIVSNELDKIIDISLNLINQLDEEDKNKCSINYVNEYIQRNCSKLSPDLLAFYIVMNAFCEKNKQRELDKRIEKMKEINSGICGGYILDLLGVKAGENLDIEMWSMSTSILNLIKGNK